MLQCLSGNSVFNNDCRKKKYEIMQHASKKVLVEHFGALDNPFLAISAIATTKKKTLERVHLYFL